MSKKAVRAKRSFAKQWFAAISGSVLVVSMQAAAEASHDRSQSFRDFKSANPDVSKHEARQMFREAHGSRGNQNPAGGITAVVPTVNVMWVDKNGVVHCGNPPARLLKEEHQHHIRNQSIQSTVSGANVRLTSGVDLDLSSVDRNITLGEKLFDGGSSVTITVGGETKTVSAGSQVTAAEYVAVKQVLGGHSQSVTVDASGRASGGEVDLNTISGPGDVTRASSLVIPENVTTYGVFGKGSEFKLNGDLDNYGSLYALGNGRNGGTVHADDITNHSGALISSTGIKLADHSHVGSSATDLNLVADGNLINDGTISSNGNISLSAGSSLTNSGSVHAKHDVSLNSASIRNSGQITGTTGDVTLDGPGDAVLNIDNTGGQISALNSINLRNAGYDGASDTTVNGGDWLSKDLNINAGNATANLSVGELTGVVHEKGLAAHVLADTETLNVGSTCLTGDPTYYNTNGNINITGNIQVGEDLVFAATGNITTNTNLNISAGDAAQGYNITMIAGVSFVNTIGGADQPSIGAIPPANPNNGLIIVSGASPGGGSITLGSGTLVNTQTTGAVGASGDVHLFAFAGSLFNSGKVDLTGTAITTGGKGGQAGGDVEIIAGAQNTTAIIMNVINTTGGFGTPGNIKATTAQPAVAGGGAVVGYAANGSIIGTDFYAPSSTVSPGGGVTVGSLTAGSINVKAGGNIVSSNSVNAVDVTFQSDSTTFVSGNVSATNSFIVFGNNFLQTGTSVINVSAAAGIAAISVSGNITGQSTTSFRGSNMFLFTSGGKIGTSAGNRFRIDADNLTINAPSGSAYISDSDTLDLDISTVGGTLDVTSGDLLNVVGTLSADVIKITSVDQITIAADISGGTSTTLHAATDIVNVGPGTISGTNVIIQADTGGAGGIGNNLQLAADNVSLFVPQSSAFITDADVVNFGGGNTFVGGSLFADSPVGITSSSLITVGLTASFDSTTISLAAPVVAGAGISIASNASVTNANISGGLSAPLISIATGGNIGTSVASPLNLDANQLQLLATGNVFVKDPNDVVLGPNVDSQSGGVFNLVAGGNIDLVKGINATGAVTLTGVNMTTAPGATVAGSGITLLATGDIGTGPLSRFNVNTTGGINANTTGNNIFLGGTGQLSVFSASASDTLDIFTTASLVSSANFSTPNLFLRAGTDLALNGNLQNNGQILLESGNQLDNGDVTGLVETNTLTLSSTNGNVGASIASPFLVFGNAKTYSVIAGNGSAFVRNQDPDGAVLGDSTTNQLLSFVSDAGLTVAGDVQSTNGNVSISAANNTLQLNDGISITAKTGIDIANNGTNSKADKLLIGQNVSMFTSAKAANQGDINITLGVAGGKAKKAPKNVTVTNVGPGVVTFFGKGAKALAPTNNFTAQGADVNVSNSLNLKNLVIGGGVNVTADPPVAPDAVTEVIIGGRNNNVPYAIAPATSPVSSAVSAVRNDLNGQQFDNSRLNMLATLPATVNTPNTMVQEMRLKTKKPVKASEDLQFVWTSGASIETR